MANKLTTFLNSGTNNYLTPQVSFNRLATDLLVPGVVGTTTNTSGAAPTTGSFGVNAQGTPNMSVAINQGQAWVNATPTGSVAQNFSVTSDASETVNINSNTTGSTVYDFIYIQLSATLLNNPDVAGLTVATFITSRSSTAYSASGANNGNSNGAIANSLLLGVVTVVNNATSISNSNITDARQGLLSTFSLPASSLLGITQLTSNVTTTSGTTVQVPGGTLTVTIPPGGRKVKVSCFMTMVGTVSAQHKYLEIWDGAVGSGTRVQGAGIQTAFANANTPVYLEAVVTPAAGSKTYNLGFAIDSGTATIMAGTSNPAILKAEVI